MSIFTFHFTDERKTRIAFTTSLDKNDTRFMCPLLLKYVAGKCKINIVCVLLYLIETYF
jgi:hypothetical protein